MTSIENEQLVKRAISYLRLGNAQEAKRILAACVQDDPANMAAWLGLAKCVEDDEQVRFCLDKVMALDARNREAKAALRRLQGGKEPFPKLTDHHRRREERGKIQRESAHRPQPERRSTGLGSLFKERRVMLLIGGVMVVFLLFVGIITAVRGAKPLAAISVEATVAVDSGVSTEMAGVEQTREHVAQPTRMIPTVDTRMLTANWREWPVVPEVREHTKEIYRDGIVQGRDPQAFSIIGDCHSAPDVLFARLVDPEFTRPEEYDPYLEAIGTYWGSWDRDFVTVQNGMSAASVLSPYWNDKDRCEADETPLACEIRLHNPSILIISIGTNWLEEDYEPFEAYYRKVLDEIISAGIVPVITTKADPTAPDFPLNLIMARLAYEYDVPLWNFWAAVQDLPDHGLDVDYEEGHHLLHEAWDVKRLTGVQVLDTLLQALKDEVPPTTP